MAVNLKSKIRYQQSVSRAFGDYNCMLTVMCIANGMIQFHSS